MLSQSHNAALSGGFPSVVLCDSSFLNVGSSKGISSYKILSLLKANLGIIVEQNNIVLTHGSRVGITLLARWLGVHRSLVYRSIHFDGSLECGDSRRVRVAIAQIIGQKPSEIWAEVDKRCLVLDDYDYEHGVKPNFQRWH